MAVFCHECGSGVEPSRRYCAECGTPVRSVDVAEVTSTPLKETPAQAALAGAGGPTVSRRAMVAGGVMAGLIAVVTVVALTGGDGGDGRPSRVTGSHPSGVTVEAVVAGGGGVEITEVEAGPLGVLPEHLEEESAWQFSFDGGEIDEAAIELPDPEAENFAVLVRVDDRWRPTAFERLPGGNLVLTLDADAAEATAAPFAGGVLAAPDGIAYAWPSDIFVAVTTIGGDFLAEIGGTAVSLFDIAYATFDEYANPPTCTREPSGATVDDDRNAKQVIRVCVEDRATGPVIRIGNNTRFALEVVARSGADLEHRAGGLDLGRIGSQGVIATGGETTEWTAADGSTATFTAEFTEYAFLRQVVTWVIDLIPAGSEVLENGEDLADAVGILKDAWSVAGGLTSAIDNLAQGNYRAAFADVSEALTNQAVIGLLVDQGFFPRLGYELTGDFVEEIFSVLQVAGHLADLGDLIYTAWATDGYVHGEVTVRLPGSAASSTTTTTTEPEAPSTTASAPAFGDLVYGDSAFAMFDADDEHTWRFLGSAGELVDIRLVSYDDFDGVLELIGPDGASLVHRDTGADGAAEAIERFTLPGSGAYLVIVTEWSGEPGEYQIDLSLVSEEPTTTSGTTGGGSIGYGETVSGSLGEGEQHEWRFDGASGDVVTISLVGFDDLDPYLTLIDVDGDIAMIDDDGGVGYDSLIDEYTLPSTGTYIIVAEDYGTNPGSYELSLSLVSEERGPTTTEPDLPPLSSGDVEVTLTWSSDADLDLHVIDPSGEEIYYANQTSASGGILEWDANDSCAISEPNPLEHVFWPNGDAPEGTYRVEVDKISCGPGGSISFRLVVKANGIVTWDVADSIDDDGTFVLEFDY